MTSTTPEGDEKAKKAAKKAKLKAEADKLGISYETHKAQKKAEKKRHKSEASSSSEADELKESPDDDDADDLAILVCSANVGNAEPTPESFGHWIPPDGSISSTLSNTKYPVEQLDTQWSNVAAETVASLKSNSEGKLFDIIVIGMQEAAFVEKSVKSVRRLSSSGAGADGSEHTNSNGAGDSERRPSSFALTPLNPDELIDTVVEGVTEGVAEINKQGQKGKNKLFKKVVKANMMVRGLTTSQTYKAPELKNSGQSKVSENAAVKSGAYDTRKFSELIQHQCPSYAMVTAKLRGEMRLIVLALKDIAEEIENVYIAGENTGIGGVMANKGGIIATFDLRGTRLSFMTSHLEAHEGQNHYMNRNKNLAEIFAGAKTDPNYTMIDATIISHHMFVCGDLNYRTNFGDGQSGKKKKNRALANKLKGSAKFSKSMLRASVKKSGHSNSDRNSAPLPLLTEEDLKLTEEDLKDIPTAPELDELKSPSSANPANGSHFAQAKSLVEAEDWKALNDGDELAMALKKKECLVGFKTLPCNFPPTFKVAREEGYQYNEKRTPSYTDRILWKSADGMVDNVVPFLYEPCPDFITSDHKPIRGGYTVKTNRGPPGKQAPKAESAKDGDRHVHLLVADIKCTNLPIMDAGVAGGLSDPYILFVSCPKPLLYNKAWPSTKVIRRNLNPVWEENYHVTVDHKACRDSEGQVSLAGSMMHLTVMDEDYTSGDDVIGTVALNLNELCSNLDLGEFVGQSRKPGTSRSSVQETVISRPILRNGLEFGMLECTIHSAYLTDRETKGFLKRSKKKVRSKTRGTSLTNKLFSYLPF